jgi:hypothetical protein
MIPEATILFATTAYPLDESAHLLSLFPEWEAWLDAISKFFPITVFGAGSAAAIIAYVKYKSDLETQRTANAQQTYRRYLEIAIDNAQFAEPKTDEVVKWLRADGEEIRRYEWFLGLLFRACDELLEHSGSDPTKWHFTIRSQLNYHKHYFKSPEGERWLFTERGIESYSRQLGAFIKAVIASP